MTGIKIVNLSNLIESIGEERTKSILSNFSCPLNPDVENFLRSKAIEFSKQAIAATHLVLMKYKKEPVVVGYFSLANKYITVARNRVSGNTHKKDWKVCCV